MRYALSVGLVAGFIWGGLWQLCAWFHFTQPAEWDWRLAWVVFVGVSLALSALLALLMGLGNSKRNHRSTSASPIPKSCLLAGVVWSLLVWLDLPMFALTPLDTRDWSGWVVDASLLLQWSLFILASLDWARQSDILKERHL